MNSLQKTVRRNVEDGYVLDWSGEWVALERAIARDIEARAHLSIGEVYHNGRWVLLEEIKSEEDLDPPPQPAPSTAQPEDESDPLADEDTVTLRVASDEQSTRTLDAADDPLPAEPTEEGVEEDTTQIYCEEQNYNSKVLNSPSQETRNDTRPISVPGRPDTVLVEVVLNESADSNEESGKNTEEDGIPDISSGLDKIFDEKVMSEVEKNRESLVPKAETESENDIDEWEQSRAGWKLAVIVAGASAVAVGGITYALVRFVF